MSKSDRGFYGHFLEIGALAEAGPAADGGDLAELRRRLRQALSQRPDDLRMLVQGANALVRAVASEGSVSTRGKKRLADSVEGLLKDLGDQLLPSAEG